MADPSSSNAFAMFSGEESGSRITILSSVEKTVAATREKPIRENVFADEFCVKEINPFILFFKL
jgi:hypothetical protein